MKINRILELIETYLPRLTAMEGDKLGLQIHSGRDEISKVLVTMELNDDVVNEAKLNGNDCIITFHPLIFNPLVSITENDRVGKLIINIISSGISLISIHTNFDSYSKGTSYIFAQKLGFDDNSFLVPDDNYPGYGMGSVCELANSITLDDLLAKVQSVCSSPIRYSRGKDNTKIKKIAIVGGSGSSFIDSALNSGADAFITADVSYHNFHRCVGKIALIDPGHYEMEQYVPLGIKNLLEEHFGKDMSLQLSKSYTNPVSYFPESGYKEKQINNLLINIRS